MIFKRHLSITQLRVPRASRRRVRVRLLEQDSLSSSLDLVGLKCVLYVWVNEKLYTDV